MENYLIIVEKQKKNYSAYSPDVPGCVATGKTEKEVRKNMTDALNFHIEGLIAEGLKVPKAKSNFYYNADNTSSSIINFRCTKTLHKKLIELSKKEDVSVSHLVNDALVKVYA